MSLHSLPLFMIVAGRPVIMIGDGEAATAKRRLLERAGAVIVGEDADARLAIIALDDAAQAAGVAARLQARGVLVNVVDRPDLCDFTLPAIIDRAPVLIAIGTGGASAGLAAALRQRLEALLPSQLGQLADKLQSARGELRRLWPDASARRRALASALAPGGVIDPLGADPDVDAWMTRHTAPAAAVLVHIRLRSPDPDDLTLRDARLLAQADRLYYDATVPQVIIDRARADAERLPGQSLPEQLPTGLSIELEMAR